MGSTAGAWLSLCAQEPSSGYSLCLPQCPIVSFPAASFLLLPFCSPVPVLLLLALLLNPLETLIAFSAPLCQCSCCWPSSIPWRTSSLPFCSSVAVLLLLALLLNPSEALLSGLCACSCAQLMLSQLAPLLIASTSSTALATGLALLLGMPLVSPSSSVCRRCLARDTTGSDGSGTGHFLVCHWGTSSARQKRLCRETAPLGADLSLLSLLGSSTQASREHGSRPVALLMVPMVHQLYTKGGTSWCSAQGCHPPQPS